MVTANFSLVDGFYDVTSKPSMIRYKSPLLEVLSTLFFALPLVLGFREQSQLLIIPMAEGTISAFNQVDVTLSRSVQIYAAHLDVTVRLTGVRYFCYHWFLSSFFVGTLCLIGVEVFCGVLLFLSWYLWSGPNKSDEPNEIFKNGASDKGRSDTDKESSRRGKAAPILELSSDSFVKSPSNSLLGQSRPHSEKEEVFDKGETYQGKMQLTQENVQTIALQESTQGLVGGRTAAAQHQSEVKEPSCNVDDNIDVSNSMNNIDSLSQPGALHQRKSARRD